MSMQRRALLGLTALAVSGVPFGCDRGIPFPRLPQVEQASEVMQGGRLRSHQTCAKTATTVRALVDCMAGFGYDFIARGPGYPAAVCWDTRDHPDPGQLPPPQCFIRTTRDGVSGRGTDSGDATR